MLEVWEEVLGLEEKRCEMTFENKDSAGPQNIEGSGHRVERSHTFLHAVLECWSLLGSPT